MRSLLSTTALFRTTIQHMRTKRGWGGGHVPPQKLSLSGKTTLVGNELTSTYKLSVNDSSGEFTPTQIVHFVGAWTGDHRSVCFIFGSESSSSDSFLGITHFFKVTGNRLKFLENACSANSLSGKNSLPPPKKNITQYAYAIQA